MAKTLADRIKDVSKSAAPSMVPALPPPPREEVIVPDISELITDKADLLKIKRLVQQSLDLAEQIKELDKLRTPLTDELKKLAGKHQIGKASVGDARISYYEVPRTSIDAALLMGAGVTPKQIEAGTKTKYSYTLRVSRASEKEE